MPGSDYRPFFHWCQSWSALRNGGPQLEPLVPLLRKSDRQTDRLICYEEEIVIDINRKKARNRQEKFLGLFEPVLGLCSLTHPLGAIGSCVAGCMPAAPSQCLKRFVHMSSEINLTYLYSYTHSIYTAELGGFMYVCVCVFARISSCLPDDTAFGQHRLTRCERLWSSPQ